MIFDKISQHIQVVSYQNLMIAFFDKKNEITKNYDLWVHIAIPSDPNTVCIRKAVKRPIYDQSGEKTFIHEKDLYKIAYKKFQYSKRLIFF